MNNKCKFLIILSLILIFATLQVKAEKYKGHVVKKSPKENANCLAPANITEISLNNVRAVLKTNGTMWFLENAEYEVPKGSGKTSLFSSSLWIGGRDMPNGLGSLYLAAMRFNQVGNDYWTGPLKMKDFSIDPFSCSYYDKFYRISRIEVERHIVAFGNDPSYVIPKSIIDYPAHGREGSGESRFLMPFVNVAGDPNTYEPELGDYPYYDFSNDLCPWTDINKERAKLCPWVDENGDCDPLSPNPIPNTYALPMPMERIETRLNNEYGWDNKMIYADHVLKGDETVIWFLNDNGGPHTETGCVNSIGLEIRVQAFAFATNDELNKMTFYSYEIINRGSTTLYDTYFCQWCDPDLGYAKDDYVGCDIIRGLGYCYNATEIDGSGEIFAYGENPPAVGLDFFQGPYIDPDGTDNPKFDKNKADVHGDPEKVEYCKRFVDYVVGLERDNPNSVYVVDDTVELRFNNQFAINGVNFGDGIVDNERFGMRAFTYHNNEQGGMGDPSADFQYYRYLTGLWNDGVPFSYGGSGHSLDDNILYCDFVFPKGTDLCNWGTKGIAPDEQLYGGGGWKGSWSEDNPNGIGSSPNDPQDRRFMQSAGPFTLIQGACNYITVGVPWARATQGGRLASVDLLMIADDKCQALFENCFKLLDGPDAPNLTIREYDQKLIVLISNSPLSNNANEDYIETDQTIPKTLEWISGETDKEYRFEGYQIYQVIGPEVGANDLDNPSLARLIRQYDIINFDDKGNPVGRLINWEFDENMQIDVPKEKVNGSNLGIEHSFEVTQDAFATGSKQLVNYKTYYFIGVAYAYNQFWPYSVDPVDEHGLYGQKLPYLRGRKTAEGQSVVPIEGIPHPPSLHNGGTTLTSDYGSIPSITRIDGQGNGGIALELTKETIDKIVSGGDKGDYRVRELKYEKNAGPLNIKVVDPLRVKPFEFLLVINDPIMDNDSVSSSAKNRADVSDNAYWILTIDPTVSDKELIEVGLVDSKGKVTREFTSQTNIGQLYEQIIFPLGISIGIKNVDFVSRDPKVKQYEKKILSRYSNDLYRIKYAFYQSEKIDINNDIVCEKGFPWITGLVDDNKNLPSNWIRSGNYNLGVWSNSNTIDIIDTFYKRRLEDFFFHTTCLIPDGPDVTQKADRAFKDYLGKFGTVCGGTWAPYVLASPYDGGPQAKYTAPEPTFPGINEPLYDGPGGTAGACLGTNNYYDFTKVTDLRCQPGYNQTMINLYSVNVVITPDKSKWTRSIVLEACQDPALSEGGALKNEPRKAKSVGKDGKPDNSTDGFGGNGDEGMGWFPGYAINIETGERLNIMFAENSDITLNEEFGEYVNGRDMIFNPTSTYAIAKYDIEYGPISLTAGTPIPKVLYDEFYEYFGAEILYYMGIERVWGGMHYVYVCGSSGNTSPIFYLARSITSQLPTNFLNNAVGRRNYNLWDTTFTLNNKNWGGIKGYIDAAGKYPYYECGPYDESKWLVEKFKQVQKLGIGYNTILERKNVKMQLFNNVMYTHIPLQPEDPDIQKQWMSCDLTYKIRVTRPYLRYISRWYDSPEKRDIDYEVPGELNYQGFPVFKFSTKELTPVFEDSRLYQSILDNINIVPNPYYARSLYEGNTLQTMVKITNLPTKTNTSITVSIYTVSGTLVRTLTKGDIETTFINWDLKNYANIPISSGVYIIHVNCPGIGERMLKFFCTMRQTDLNTF